MGVEIGLEDFDLQIPWCTAKSRKKWPDDTAPMICMHTSFERQLEPFPDGPPNDLKSSWQHGAESSECGRSFRSTNAEGSAFRHVILTPCHGHDECSLTRSDTSRSSSRSPS